ncbi:hypothetical protein KDA23_03985 [Candidatus Saccharibacteria bacterium]|nr:hypothetical protein [Candidatus Saccharibacteria bacterium]
MDFSSRNTQPAPAAPRAGDSFSPDGHMPKSAGPKRSASSKMKGAWGKRGVGVMLIVVALLLAAVVGILLTAGDKKEANLVDSTKLQAVFLQNDQVYFGHILELNNQYLVLSDIYYLQTSGTGTNTNTSTNNNVSLVKLGCELHKPYDRMVVNRGEVEFWENLQADGQVAKAVDSFVKENPNGQQCSNTTNSTQNVQGAGTGSATTGTGNTGSNSSTTTP